MSAPPPPYSNPVSQPGGPPGYGPQGGKPGCQPGYGPPGGQPGGQPGYGQPGGQPGYGPPGGQPGYWPPHLQHHITKVNMISGQPGYGQPTTVIVTQPMMLPPMRESPVDLTVYKYIRNKTFREVWQYNSNLMIKDMDSPQGTDSRELLSLHNLLLP
ncbi:unnamed protein product [Mytilus edulis]|uniref:Uncharacterized protein n=1 Tax=Mytilus edulis TaxID=6550 RepID=A0A8S3UYA8_MYTED|nr:unnamed protein product [Mytilus edulis]